MKGVEERRREKKEEEQGKKNVNGDVAETELSLKDIKVLQTLAEILQNKMSHH
jgi:hypothetical protein